MNKLLGAVLFLVCLQILKPKCLCSKPYLPVTKMLLSRAVCYQEGGSFPPTALGCMVGARVFLVIQ